MQEFEIKQIEMDFRASEAFKTLRTNIEFSGEDVQVIAITSATPNEGKSSVSFAVIRTGRQEDSASGRGSAEIRDAFQI